jgi:undecaprenyl diphosphate synthase
MKHVAIIMDGNGRWAEAKRVPRLEGHRRGAEATRKATRSCIEHKIPYLTIYAFSAENWQRPEEEVRDLMGLLRHYLKNEIKELHENNIRLRVIGDRSKFDKDLNLQIEQAEAKTIANTGLNLQIALSYGGRQELEMAARKMAENGGKLEDYLYTAGMPDPDLLIRTGGELRISNFLLWQMAYTELYFTETLWPDFDAAVFDKAIEEFTRRVRRFGRR